MAVCIRTISLEEVHFRLNWYLHLHAASEPNELLPCFLLQISAGRDFFDDYSIDDSKRKISSKHIPSACDSLSCKFNSCLLFIVSFLLTVA